MDHFVGTASADWNTPFLSGLKLLLENMVLKVIPRNREEFAFYFFLSVFPQNETNDEDERRYDKFLKLKPKTTTTSTRQHDINIFCNRTALIS